jgi:hypothetical protein
MTVSTILFWFHRTYVLRIKMAVLIGSGMHVRWGKGKLHSEQVTDIAVIAMKPTQ